MVRITKECLKYVVAVMFDVYLLFKDKDASLYTYNIFHDAVVSVCCECAL